LKNKVFYVVTMLRCLCLYNR